MPGKGLQILNGLQTEGLADLIQEEGACEISLSDSLGVSEDGSGFNAMGHRLCSAAFLGRTRLLLPSVPSQHTPHRQGSCIPRGTCGSKLKAEEETEQNDTG